MVKNKKYLQKQISSSPQQVVKWFVYIIRTKNNLLYTGITTNVERRFSEHQRSKKGAKFFRQSPPLEVVYIEQKKNRSNAMKRENAIKKLNRKEKEILINSKNQIGHPI